MEGFTIICNKCGVEVEFNEEINKNVYIIEVEGSGQIDIDAVWIECNECGEETQIGYTMYD